MKPVGDNKYKKKKISSKVDANREENKIKFLARLEQIPIIQAAAAFVGIHRSTYYRWCEDDPEFKAKAEVALSAGVNLINDIAESGIITKIKEGSLPAIRLWLQYNHSKYMEMHRYHHFHEHEFKDSPLTEERKNEIAKCVARWDEVDEEDELESDYLLAPDDPERQ